MRERVTIGFGFTPDWLTKCREIIKPITTRSERKTKANANYFRHSSENRSNNSNTKTCISYVRINVCKASVNQQLVPVDTDRIDCRFRCDKNPVCRTQINKLRFRDKQDCKILYPKVASVKFENLDFEPFN